MRRLLGPAFPPFGHAYRRLFVDIGRVAKLIARETPQGAHVLDIGGGDGCVADRLAALRPDLQITLADIAPQIGAFIRPAQRARIALRPATTVTDLQGRFDVIAVSDVIHHVPTEHRADFLADVTALAGRTGCRKVLVKDIEPGGLRARLALWGDLYITGDRQVRQVSAADLHLPGFEKRATVMVDHPNYCLVFEAEPLALAA